MELEPPPAGACFAITNVLGPSPDADEVDRFTVDIGKYTTETRAVLWIKDADDGYEHFWCLYRASDVWLSVAHEGDQPFRQRQAVVYFESGWRVSVVWGSCTYSTNHDAIHGREAPPFSHTPTTVEVAVLDREGTILGDEPYAYLGPAEALAILDEVATQPSGPCPSGGSVL